MSESTEATNNEINSIVSNFLTTATTNPSVKMHHFNNAGASPSPNPVLQTMIQHYLLETTFDGYYAAETQEENIANIYKSIQALIHAPSSEEIALVESATVAWTRVFYSMVKYIQRGDILLCSEVEYAANVVAMQKLVLEKELELVVLPSSSVSDSNRDSSSGVVDLDILCDILHGRYILPNSHNNNPTFLNPEKIYMICITHIPTNCGIINPVSDIGELIHVYNQKYRQKQDQTPIYYLVDAYQSVGQIPINVQTMKCHALTATGRKYLRGPRGTGFLYISQSISNILEVSHIDHYGTLVQNVDRMHDSVTFRYRQGAKKFEFFESSIANRLGLGAAVDYALSIELQVIEEKCLFLSEEMRLRLRQIPNVCIHHDNTQKKKQSGIVTFHVKGYDSKMLKEELFDKFRFLTAIVPALSTPFDSKKSGLILYNGKNEQGISSSSTIDLLRVSLTYFNTLEEIELFYSSLRSIVDTS